MALDIAQGTVTLPGSGSVSVNLGWVPKAMLFHWGGAADNSNSTQDRGMFGVAGTGYELDGLPGTVFVPQASVSWTARNAQNPSDTAVRTHNNNAIHGINSNAGKTLRGVGYVTYTATGFQINVSNRDGNAFDVNWIALGGSDIEVASVHMFQDPAVAGSLDVPTSYIDSSGGSNPYTPNSVIIISSGANTVDTTQSRDARPLFGVAASGAGAACISGRSQNANASPTNQHRLSNIALSHTQAWQTGALAFSTNKVTLTTEAHANPMTYALLAIKGPAMAAGTFQAPAAPGDTTVSTGGLSPSGIIVFGSGLSTAVNSVGTHKRYVVGFRGPDNEATAGGAGQAATVPTVEQRWQYNDRVIQTYTPAGAASEQATISDLAGGGFTLTWAAAASGRYGFLAIGGNLSIEGAGGITRPAGGGMGTPAVTPTINVEGIPSSEAFGDQVIVAGPLSVGGIPAPEDAVGTPAFTGGLLAPRPVPGQAYKMQFIGLDNVPRGEIIGAADRVFTWRLNQAGTLQFRLNLRSPIAKELLAQKEGYITLWFGNELVMTTEVKSIQPQGDARGGSIAVVAQETLWSMFQKRLVGKSAQGLVGPANPIDQGTWLAARLGELNAGGGGNHTGLIAGTIIPSGTIQGGGPWRYTPFLQIVQMLSASTGGFDYRQRPRDPARTNGQTGYFDVMPVLGEYRPNAVFEYGLGGRSAREYSWLIDNDKIVTDVFAGPPSGLTGGGLTVLTAGDATARLLRRRREELITEQIDDAAMRQAYANEVLLVRKQPREVFLIQPDVQDYTGRVPQFLVDYGVGDTIRGRVNAQGVLLLDGLVRVYGVSLAIDENGKETYTLTVVDE